MIKKTASSVARIARHKRVRKHISGTTERPRLAVFRSNKHMYAQIIDDTTGVTLCAASTLEAGLKFYRYQPLQYHPSEPRIQLEELLISHFQMLLGRYHRNDHTKHTYHHNDALDFLLLALDLLVYKRQI